MSLGGEGRAAVPIAAPARGWADRPRPPSCCRAWAATLALASCATLIACGQSSTLEIRPRGSLTDSSGLAGLRLEVQGRTLAAGDFAPDPDGIQEVTVPVPNRGRLEVQVALRQAGVIVAAGRFGWEMAPGWAWGMDIFRQVEDPAAMCLGCSGSAAISVDPAFATVEGEALWFSWGGKPKDSDIVF